MMSLKKMIMKRVIRKNAKQLQSMAKRTYRDVSKDVGKRMSSMKMPVKITLTR
jgi:hypothetical protein